MFVQAHLVQHTSVEFVVVDQVRMSARDMETLVDALLLLPRAGLCMVHCCRAHNAAPSIARLLRLSNLTRLEMWYGPYVTTPWVAPVAQALRDARALMILTFGFSVTEYPEDFDLIGDALVGHQALRVITLGSMGRTSTLAGRLVAASECQLATLRLLSHQSAAELRPLFAALPSNTRLAELEVNIDGQLPAAEVLAAVVSNASLVALKLNGYSDAASPEQAQAMSLVAARAQ